MKAMEKTEQQEEVAVKERDDGTALAALEDKPDPFGSEEAKDEEAKDEEVEASSEEQPEEEDDEDREALREARREERKLKKELAKQREVSAKHKISALERRNEEMARRLAQLESTATGFQFAQLDRYIEDEATRVEYAKMKMTQAAQAGNAVEQAEFMEQFHEAKNKLAQAQMYRQQQLEEAKRPRNNVPSPMSEAVKENAGSWLTRNTWYDPNGQDMDSKIAKVVDNALASEGWDPADPEYWEELDNRLKERLPHRYTGKSGVRNRRSGTPSGRSDVSGSPAAKNTFTLSRERVQALKDAGMWDDPAKRAKAIRRYAEFDRSNRG
jgi:hypothetical protein